MGTNYSGISRDHPDHVEKDQTKGPRSHLSKIVKTNPYQIHHHPGTLADSDGSKMTTSKKGPLGHWNTVAALDEVAKKRLKSKEDASLGKESIASGDYEQQRSEVLERERALWFEWHCENSATPQERTANQILQMLKANDDKNVFAAAEKRKGHGGQEHTRLAGDHFLSNKSLIDETEVFKIARQMPKGAHLHIHFNACLDAGFLLNIAKKMDNMFISSDIQLDRSNEQSFDRCKIQFHILKESVTSYSLFDSGYTRGANPIKGMRFKDFLTELPAQYPRCQAQNFTPIDWLKQKLVFHEEEAHNVLQTVHGAWEEFNTRTQMMKGLFNYERAYREYTRSCLQDFVDDNIQYAEIRPNFMATNQVWRDDASEQMNNFQIMQMIVDECIEFQKTNPTFGGLKIIYCCPRSYSRELVKGALDECLEFRIKWPKWIAGFDLVGEESKGHALNYFSSEFRYFQQKCELEGVKIPFLFHCGETLEMGNDTDGNLVDALLLKSKRIGHGFALARHPYIMERMKKENICLEVCPISNEVLGLTPRANGHSMYNLLANNVHCTVSSDNGTLFNSTLSHDFYQVMVGKSDMTLFGWKQLIKWSLEHACMTPDEYDTVYANWEQSWEKFVVQIVSDHGSDLEAFEAKQKAARQAVKEKEAAEHEALQKAEQEDLVALKKKKELESSKRS